MKTRNLLMMSLLAFSSMTMISFANDKVVNAEEPTMGKEVIYEVDFEKYDTTTSPDSIYQDGIVWTETSMVTARIVETENGKVYNYEVSGKDNRGYTKFGGFGVAQQENLKKLINGQTYTLSIDVSLIDVAENSKVYIEYQNDASWTGVAIHSNGSVEVLGSTSNVSYVNGTLTFNLVAGMHKGQNGYVNITGQDLDLGDKVAIDNFKIVRDRSGFVYDFENVEVGKTAGGGVSNIPNVWNASVDTIEIKEDNNNKYMHVNDVFEGIEEYSNFYFNQLPLTSGETYRLSFDFIEQNFTEMYIAYHENGYAHIAYNSNGASSVITGSNAGNEEYVIGGTFDDTHVTFDFTPNSLVNNQFWNQVIVIVKHTDDLTLKIDNFKLDKLSSMSASLEVTPNTQYVGEEISLDGVVLTYGEDDTRVLKEGEYTLDTTKVNNQVAGKYEVVATAVNEMGVKVTDTFEVEFIEDEVSTIDVNTLPSKVEYIYGEELDLTGLTIIASMQSGRDKEVVVTNDMVSGYDKNKLGNQEIIISYEGLETIFEVSVIDYIESISIKSNPTKTEYELYDSLDLTGCKITVTMKSGNTTEVDVTNAMVSGYNPTTIGEKTITVTYEEKITTFKVIVKETVTINPETPSTSEPINNNEKDENAGCKGSAGTSMLALIAALGTLLLKKKR